MVTGKLENFTSNTINDNNNSIGATAGSYVTQKIDCLICGEKQGSKPTKAKEIGISVLTGQEFQDGILA